MLVFAHFLYVCVFRLSSQKECQKAAAELSSKVVIGEQSIIAKQALLKVSMFLQGYQESGVYLVQSK